jgi:hypothetical protein
MKKGADLCGVRRPLQPARWCVGASRLFEAITFQGKSIGVLAYGQTKGAPVCGTGAL